VSSAVLDASAVLTLLQNEPGAPIVQAAIQAGAALGAVNLAEVISKLAERGMALPDIDSAVDGLALDIVPLDGALARRIGALRPLTRSAGLSLGDRACLALASSGLPALTTDRQWAGLAPGIIVQVIR
jgi:PIN domain nuclease of toxin-antitoxin system